LESTPEFGTDFCEKAVDHGSRQRHTATNQLGLLQNRRAPPAALVFIGRTIPTRGHYTGSRVNAIPDFADTQVVSHCKDKILRPFPASAECRATEVVAEDVTGVGSEAQPGNEGAIQSPSVGSVMVTYVPHPDGHQRRTFDQPKAPPARDSCDHIRNSRCGTPVPPAGRRHARCR